MNDEANFWLSDLLSTVCIPLSAFMVLVSGIAFLALMAPFGFALFIFWAVFTGNLETLANPPFSIEPLLGIWFGVWAIAAFFLSLRNVVLGFETMRDPTRRRVLHLLVSSAVILLTFPLFWTDLV